MLCNFPGICLLGLDVFAKHVPRDGPGGNFVLVRHGHG